MNPSLYSKLLQVEKNIWLTLWRERGPDNTYNRWTFTKGPVGRWGPEVVLVAHEVLKDKSNDTLPQT